MMGLVGSYSRRDSQRDSSVRADVSAGLGFLTLRQFQTARLLYPLSAKAG